VRQHSPPTEDGVWGEGCAPPQKIFCYFTVENVQFYAFLGMFWNVKDARSIMLKPYADSPLHALARTQA